MNSKNRKILRKIRDHGISVDETIFQINVPKEEIKA